MLALGAGSATPEGQIVVHGAHSGSTLELQVKGKRLVVEGLMARAHPRGCHFTRYRMAASCPLRNVGSIVVRMGPSGDFVEVLNRLPVPLTAYLGDGSDKFVGNGERDTCYSEGARRNRCVGGPARTSASPATEQRLRRRRRQRLLPDRRRQRRLLGRARPRRLPDGPGAGRLPRRRRQRPALRGPEPGPALRGRGLRPLRRDAGLGSLGNLRGRPAALSLRG